MADLERRNLTRIEIPTLLDEREAFRAKVIGQEEAVGAFATLYAKLKSGIRPSKPGPLDIKFLAGPSGVGKTEIVYRLAEVLSIEKDNPRAKVIKIDGADYQQEHMVTRLIGSPPGYRGSEDPEKPGSGAAVKFSQDSLNAHAIKYTDNAGRERTVVIILVDEAEKAHDDLHRAFLAVLDKGRMDLASNKSTDFTNAVIFYTSNVGNNDADRLRARLAQDPSVSDETRAQAVREVVETAFFDSFPPEFRGRVKDLIIFNNLNPEAIQKITEMKLKAVEEQFMESGINIRLDVAGSAREWIIAQGYNASEGVRSLEKVIEKHVHDNLILAHVGFDIDGKEIRIDKLEDEGELAFYFNEDAQLPKASSNKSSQPLSPAPTTQQQIGEIRQTPIKTAKPNIVMAQPNIVMRQPPQIAQPHVRARAEAGQQQQHAQTAPEQAAQNIPPKIRGELIFAIRHNGIMDYVAVRDRYAKTGFLDPQAANSLEEVRSESANSILFAIKDSGVEKFAEVRDRYVRAGIFTREQVNKWQSILNEAHSWLRFIYRDKGLSEFTAQRDRYVRNGLGTVEEWNKIVFET